MKMTKENSLLQTGMNHLNKTNIASLLARFSSEQLLNVIHNRRDIYIEGWYNAEHINENTGLPTEYCPSFIKWAGDSGVCSSLDVALEQWIDLVKEELKDLIWQQGEEVSISYAPEDGFHAEGGELYNAEKTLKVARQVIDDYFGC
jgi:hypothetical protein